MQYTWSVCRKDANVPPFFSFQLYPTPSSQSALAIPRSGCMVCCLVEDHYCHSSRLIFLLILFIPIAHHCPMGAFPPPSCALLWVEFLGNFIPVGVHHSQCTNVYFVCVCEHLHPFQLQLPPFRWEDAACILYIKSNCVCWFCCHVIAPCFVCIFFYLFFCLVVPGALSLFPLSG